MKHSVRFFFIVLLFTSLIGCGSSNTQKAITEQTITAKIKKTFPKSTIVSINKEQRNDKDQFAVVINDGEDKRSLRYSESGILVEITQSVQPAQLPPMITKSVQEQYPEGIVFMALKTTRGKTVFYQLAVRDGARKIEMNLDAKGKPILR
jgi:hypothetical protein